MCVLLKPVAQPDLRGNFSVGPFSSINSINCWIDMNLTEGGLWNLLTWHRTLDTAHYRTHRKTSRFGLRIEYHLAVVLRLPAKNAYFFNGTRASLKLPDKVQPEMSCNGVSIGAGVDS
jgi:hypothetical protein